MEISEIADLLRSDADAVARKLLPAGRYEQNGREWRCSGRNSPTGTAISVHVARDDKQGVCGFWNETERGGDLIDLYRITQGCTARDAIRWAKNWLDLDDEPATRPNLAARRRRDIRRAAADESYQKRQSGRLQFALQVWKECGPVQGPGLAYLKQRGLNSSYIGTEIRLHPNLPHPDGQIFPALVCRVSDIANHGVGIWRIYLKPTGEGKAPVENPKLGLGQVAGGAVRIGGVWTEIGIAEGIETALACRQMIHASTGILVPVWSALSTSGMRGIRLPPEITSVRIYADGDPVRFRNNRLQEAPGQSAAHELSDRLRSEGRSVVISTPPIGTDWLDVLNSNQKDKAHEKSQIPRAA